MELLFGVGAQPKQTDDVRHRPSQVLPKAMRVGLGAGELGRYVEIDEVLSHEDVGHAITIVSDRPEAPSAGHILRVLLQIKQLHLLLRSLAGR